MPPSHTARPRRPLGAARVSRWIVAGAVCALLAAPARSVSFATLTADDGYDPIVIFAVGSQFGSGVLIAPDWVLTAGHVADLFAPGAEVFFDPSTPTTPTRTRSVTQAFAHPLYSAVTVEHDVGLIQLASPILDVAPLALFDDTAFDPTSLEGGPVTLTGWGGTTSGSFGLTAAEVSLSEFVADSTGRYATTHPLHHTLPGDSGGPLLATTGLGFGVLGVNSFVSGSISFAASVGHHRAFVDAHVSGVQWLGPVAVPEPALPALLLLGGVVVGRRRVRGQAGQSGPSVHAQARSGA